MAEPEKLRIGDFVLDPSRNLLCGLEGELALEPKVVDVLLTLAAEPGVVLSRDALIDAVWKAEFGADERLTRAIYQLRKAFSDDRGSHRYIETVSKRGYRLVAAVEVLAETPAQSQPPAISAPAPPNVEAPSPEPQTDAPTRTAVDVSYPATIERSPPPSPVRWWQNRSAHAAGAAAVLALVAIAAWLWTSSGPAETRYAEDVIELRPVVVIGDEPGLPDFARGAYAAVKRVFASHQLRAVEHDDTPPQEPARRESEFILSGTLEKAADAYTVTLYFDNRANGQTLWSERLIRPVAQKTELQEAIGAIAANLISCGLRQRAKALRRPSLQAFMIYLEICDPKLWSDNGETALATAERLVAIAPDDPHGHGYAAFVNSVLAKDRPDFTLAQIDFYDGAARKAAARALELDPKNEDALAATALLGSGAQHWLGLDALAERIAWMKSWSLRRSGRITEAFHVQGTVVASTPLSLNDRVARASLAITAGYHEAADRELANVLQLQPDHRGGHWHRFQNAAFYGDPKRALALLEANFLAWEAPERSCWRAFLEARTKTPGHARVQTVRAACADNFRTSDDPGRDYVRRMLAALGDVEGVFERMQTKTWGWAGSTIMLWYPEMAAIRRDARFMPLIAQTGLPEYWLKSGNWPDFCRDDVLPYDCKAAARRALTDLRPGPRADAASKSETDVVDGGREVGKPN